MVANKRNHGLWLSARAAATILILGGPTVLNPVFTLRYWRPYLISLIYLDEFLNIEWTFCFNVGYKPQFIIAQDTSCRLHMSACRTWSRVKRHQMGTSSVLSLSKFGFITICLSSGYPLISASPCLLFAGPIRTLMSSSSSAVKPVWQKHSALTSNNLKVVWQSGIRKIGWIYIYIYIYPEFDLR